MHPNPKILVEYLPIAVFFSIAAFISLVVIILPKIFAKETPQKDKLKSFLQYRHQNWENLYGLALCMLIKLSFH